MVSIAYGKLPKKKLILYEALEFRWMYTQVNLIGFQVWGHIDEYDERKRQNEEKTWSQWKKNRDLMNASKNKTNNRHLPNVYLTF